MTIDDEPPVFVEREFTCEGQPLIVRFFQPARQPTEEYKCEWEIHWPDRVRKSRSYGVDSIQSLMLSMRTVHTELVLSDFYQAGQLTYFDSTDFDLPPHYNVEP